VEFSLSILWITAPSPRACCLHIITEPRIKIEVCLIAPPAGLKDEMLTIAPNLQKLASFEHRCIDWCPPEGIGRWWQLQPVSTGNDSTVQKSQIVERCHKTQAEL
jgi:hypothetical protein